MTTMFEPRIDPRRRTKTAPHKVKPKLTPRRMWTLWGIGNLAAGAFMIGGISESVIGAFNAGFSAVFFIAGAWILYCAYDMESGPHE